MFNARELLGELMQAGMTRSSGQRVGHALGAREPAAGGDQGSKPPGGLPQGGGGGDNPLSDLLGGLGLGQGGTGGLGGLADAARSMLGGAGRVAKDNPLAIGGLAALAGAFLGGKSGVPKGAIGGGALALLASLALTSLKGKDQAPAAPSQEDPAGKAPLGLREPQNPAEEQQLQDKASLMMRAMINAAKADGAIDGGEMQRITGKLETGGADPAARDFVLSEMKKPLDTEALIRKAQNPQTAMEIYAASLLAIEVDTPGERDYLRGLAQGLKLDPSAVQRAHEALGVKAAA